MAWSLQWNQQPDGESEKSAVWWPLFKFPKWFMVAISFMISFCVKLVFLVTASGRVKNRFNWTIRKVPILEKLYYKTAGWATMSRRYKNTGFCHIVPLLSGKVLLNSDTESEIGSCRIGKGSSLTLLQKHSLQVITALIWHWVNSLAWTDAAQSLIKIHWRIACILFLKKV